MKKSGKDMFSISPGFAILLGICLLFDYETAFAVSSSVIIHELGHLSAIKLYKVKPKHITLSLSGFCIEYSNSALSYKKEIIISAAGPAFSLLLAIVASFTGKMLASDLLYYISGVSTLLFVYNMLPAKILDGGRILYMCTALAYDTAAAERVSGIASMIVIYLLLLAGAAVLFVSHGNCMLIFGAVVLYIYCCKNRRNSVQ